MQLNPGLAVKHSGVASSEPSLLKRSSLMLLPGSKGSNSWVTPFSIFAIEIVLIVRMPIE